MARHVLPGLLLLLLPAPAWGQDAPQVRTIAGAGDAANNGDNGDALAINVGQPFGVEYGPDGALYITEVQHHRVRRVDRQTGRITTVAGCGRKGYSGDGGPARDAELNEPYEVRFDGQGSMYFVEMMNHLVRKVNLKSGQISTIAGTGEKGYGGDGGPAIKAQFNVPHSIALDGKGGLYIADIGNHRVRRVDLATGVVESVAGNGSRELPRDGQVARGQPLIGPRALFYREGSLWIALREGHSVWRLDLEDGRLRHVAGAGKAGYDERAVEGVPAAEAHFNGPKGLALDSEGAAYVVDTENQVIRKIHQGRVWTVAGAGPQARGFRGDNGPALEAWFDRPHGICVSPDGELVIGDTNNHRVRLVTASRLK